MAPQPMTLGASLPAYQSMRCRKKKNALPIKDVQGIAGQTKGSDQNGISSSISEKFGAGFGAGRGAGAGAGRGAGAWRGAGAS